ncbi:MAG: hypothetical protein HZB99_01640 [Candidatus Harrisonbacteria bacterium]|nr:hypothetical protein [Candidatus Harrisonbacteria bacterium]
MPSIELTSYLWRKWFTENRLPKSGIVIEVAPGYEPKIGNALALYEFQGTVFIIEPDQEAARHIQEVYKKILPGAVIKVITKPLQDVEVGADIPCRADALVASHPFDDMVIAYIMQTNLKNNLFSQEKNDGARMSAPIKEFYDAIGDKDYAHGIAAAVVAWKEFIQKLRPACFIASQYPSHMLAIKGLTKRQNSGYAVLDQLKSYYRDSLRIQCHEKLFGHKGNSRWWIIVRNPEASLAYDFQQQPLAIKRLGGQVFVPQRARRLRPEEYDVIYIDKKYFDNLGYENILKQVQDFAIILDNEHPFTSERVITYADYQKDITDIGLSGNLGSGRAVYYGNNFNILGVGKTTLCQSKIPSHSTGRTDLMGAMRRVILSRWINYFTPRAMAHPVLIALKETRQYKWNPNLLPLALLVRVDNGSLDRPSHIEYSPEIPVDFQKTLTEYARLDAEYFAYRILLGAWSNSNYSLNGQLIDLETASFVKYRSPCYTASAKHHETLFGYEGGGFLKILYQLADVKNIETGEIEKQFYQERHRHLAYCFLLLLGLTSDQALAFFSKYQDRVVVLSDQFEKLAKEIGHQKISLNLYNGVSGDQDPSLLDMSNLFRNLAKIYGSSSAEASAIGYLVRKPAWLRSDDFLGETRNFIQSLLHLLVILDSENYLDDKLRWNKRLQAINQDLPTMFELNAVLRRLVEEYRLGKISGGTLGAEIKRLCELPLNVVKNLDTMHCSRKFLIHNSSRSLKRR